MAAQLTDKLVDKVAGVAVVVGVAAVVVGGVVVDDSN